MSRPHALLRHPTRTLLALLTASSWTVALWQAMPRLLAGPICSAAQDNWVLAGHCPACAVAVLSTLGLLAHLAVPQGPALQTAAAGSPARGKGRPTRG
jgi:hypothetical protein